MSTKIALATLATLSLPLAIAACGGDTQTAPPPAAPSATPVASVTAAPPASTQEPAPTPPPKPPLADLEKATMSGLFAAFNAHDAKKLSSFYTADATVASPGPEGWKKMDRDGAEKMHAKLFADVPDVKMTAVRFLVKGDQVAVEWVGTGTDSAGEKPTNKQVGFRAASIMWFDADGNIKQQHDYLDGATIGQQLGKIPGKPRALATAPTGDAPWLVNGAADDALADKAKGMWPVSWAAHDRKAFDASITDDFVHEDIASPMDFSGRKEALKEFDMYAKAVPDQTVTVDNVWAAGGVVVMEFTFSGTQKGALGPLKATGKKFTSHGVDFDAMTGDKMSKATTYSNGVEILAQLGLMPAMGEKKDAPKKPAAPAPAPKPATKK